LTGNSASDPSLASTAAHGGAVTIAFQAARFVVQLGGLIVLARLLTPAEFGIVAMAVAVFGIGDVLREFGLNSAAVQATSLSAGQRNNLFWINGALGVALWAIFTGLGPALAAFYGRDELVLLSAFLAIQFLFSGVQTQFQAHLTRELRFFALSLTDLLAQFVAVLVAIAMALNGLGYWAIVGQLVGQQIVLLAGRSVAAHWRPGLPSRDEDMASLLRFGLNLALTQLLVYSSRSADSVLVGARYGAVQLGFYSRASQLLMMPLNQILAPMTAVALPVLSRIQNEQPRYVAFVARCQIVVVYLTAFVFSVTAASADDLVPLVFGENWSEVAPIFRILAIGGVFQAAGYVAFWVFLSKGLTGHHFRYSLVSRSVMLASIAFGSWFGIVGVAWGYTLGIVLTWPLAWWWLYRATHIHPVPLMSGPLRAVVVAIAVSAFGATVSRQAAADSHAAGVGIAGVAALGGWAIAILVFKHVRSDMLHLAQTGHLMLRRHKGDR